MRNASSLLASLLLVLTFASCAKREQPVSKDEALQFARRIEQSVTTKNEKLLNNILDPEAFAKRITARTGQKMNASLKAGIQTGLENRRLGYEIIKSVGPTGSYKLLRQYDSAGVQHLIFRLYGSDGINYHDLQLVKVGREIKASDILIYYTGEYFSETIGQFLADVESAGNKSPDVEQLKEVRTLISQGRLNEAREELDKLPPAIRNGKLGMMVNVQICSGLHDNAAYIQSIEEYAKAFPNSPNLPLLMIDAYILNKEYDKALSAVEKLNEMVGGDPFQDYFRGLIHKMSGDTAKYVFHIERLYKNDPNFQDGALEMINAEYAAGNEAKAQEVIAAYRANKNFEQSTLESYLLLTGHSKTGLESLQ